MFFFSQSSHLYLLRAQLGCHAAPDSCSKGTPAAKRAIQHKCTLMWRRTNIPSCFNKTAKASKWGGYKHCHATWTAIMIHEQRWCYVSWNYLYKSKNLLWWVIPDWPDWRDYLYWWHVVTLHKHKLWLSWLTFNISNVFTVGLFFAKN